MGKPTWPRAELDLLVDLWNKRGYSAGRCAQVMAEHGYSRSRNAIIGLVNRHTDIFHRRGQTISKPQPKPKAPSPFTEADKKIVGQMWASGCTVEEIALRAGRTISAIGAFVARNRDLCPQRKQGWNKIAKTGHARAPNWSTINVERDAGKPETNLGDSCQTTARLPNDPQSEAKTYDDNSCKITLMQITERTCRWPLNDPHRGEEFLFCGCDSEISESYCAHHRMRAGRSVAVKAYYAEAAE